MIKNYGASVARNVNVLFDPPLPVTDDVARNVHWIAQRYYARPVPVWAPGTMLSNVFVHPKENPGRVTVRLSGGPATETSQGKSTPGTSIARWTASVGFASS